MRLTHLCEYADKRKNREPMLKIRNKLFFYENIEDKHNVLSLDDLDHRLTALEIIREKRVFIEELLQSDNLDEYNDYVEEQGRYDEDKLIQEEFDLLKEILQ